MMNRIKTGSLLGLALCLSLGSAHAEFRVALVIGDGDTRPAAAKLEKSGYRCELSKNLDERELARLIEGWTNRTPTNSTALIYFSGAVQTGADGLRLVSSDGRFVPVAKVFEMLDQNGGSRDNRLVIDSPQTPAHDPALPAGCYFAYADHAELAPRSTPSIAISPPDQFVAGKKAGDEWVNQRGMIFCWCPPGNFTPGSPEGTPGRYADEAQREVVIAEGFWIGKYELTRAQRLRNLSGKAIGSHKNHPIESLHWDDGSRMVAQTLTEQERQAGRLPASWEYHLPTSDQWEYAARAGTQTRYYFGDDMRALPQHANFADKSYYDSGDIYSNSADRTLDDGSVYLSRVGSYQPNPWGLHDVYGNVAEWCRDKSALGGGWVSVPENCRSAYRDSYSSRDEQDYLGYRIVIQPNSVKAETEK